MAFRADRRETMHDADGYGKEKNECGDTVEIYVKVERGRIQAASFQTNGCLHTVACVNSLLELVDGKAMEEALAIRPDDLIAYLETLPAEEAHCADLAVAALRSALAEVHAE